MSPWVMRFEGVFRRTKGRELDEITDRLMEELEALGAEPDIGGSLASGRFELSVVIRADSFDEARDRGLDVFTRAFEAVGIDADPPGFGIAGLDEVLQEA